jgi:hypothetical protein
MSYGGMTIMPIGLNAREYSLSNDSDTVVIMPCKAQQFNSRSLTFQSASQEITAADLQKKSITAPFINPLGYLALANR